MLRLWHWIGACEISTPVWIVLLGFALGLGRGDVLAADSDEALFNEAQRHHLGIDVPVDYRRAYELYMELIQRNPRHRDAHYNIAHICFEQKRYDLAADHYQRVIRLDPQDSDAYNNLGTVYLRQGKQEAAKKAYMRAVQLNRDLSVAYYNLALIFLREGNRDRAEKAIDQALRVEPDNAEFVKLRSIIRGETEKISNTVVLAVVGGFVGIIVGYYYVFSRKGV